MSGGGGGGGLSGLNFGQLKSEVSDNFIGGGGGSRVCNSREGLSGEFGHSVSASQIVGHMWRLKMSENQWRVYTVTFWTHPRPV